MVVGLLANHHHSRRLIGDLTPQLVVAEAQANRSSAGKFLHTRLEWDNRVAGDAWRLEQARELIRSVRVRYREEVDAFHAAALAAGGEDHGKPGLRPDYGPSYYAAFVKDRERNNIEVVCYARPRRTRSKRRAAPRGSRTTGRARR